MPVKWTRNHATDPAVILQAIRDYSDPILIAEVCADTKGKNLLLRFNRAGLQTERHVSSGLVCKATVLLAQDIDQRENLVGKELSCHICLRGAGDCPKLQAIQACHIDALRILTPLECQSITWMKDQKAALKSAFAPAPKRQAPWDAMSCVISDIGKSKARRPVPLKNLPQPALSSSDSADGGSADDSDLSDGSDAAAPDDKDMKRAKALSKIHYLQEKYKLAKPKLDAPRPSLFGKAGVTPLQKHQAEPGRLALAYVKKVNGREFDDDSRVGPCLSRYAKRVLMVGIDAPRSKRELLTLCRAADQLLAVPSWTAQLQVAAALDILIMRVQAIKYAHQLMATATSDRDRKQAWPLASELELVPPEDWDLSDDEAEGAAKRYRDKARFQSLRIKKRTHAASSSSSDSEQDQARAGAEAKKPSASKKKKARRDRKRRAGQEE